MTSVSIVASWEFWRNGALGIIFSRGMNRPATLGTLESDHRPSLRSSPVVFDEYRL